MISSEVKVDVVMDWTKRLCRWFPVMLALCLVAACSSDEPTVGELPPGVVEGSPSVGIASPSTGSPTTPGPTAFAGCPNQQAVASDPARQVGPSVSGDVDGDGATDSVHVSRDPDGSPECAAFVVVDTAATVTLAAPVWQIGIQGGLPAPRIHGFADLNDDGSQEILVDEAAGASTQFVGAFIFSDESLERVTVPGTPESGGAPGAEDLFAYGGSVGHSEAVDCTGPGTIVISTATPSSVPSEAERGIYEIERRFFVFDGTELERGEVDTEKTPIGRLSRFPEYSSSPFGSC